MGTVLFIVLISFLFWVFNCVVLVVLTGETETGLLLGSIMTVTLVFLGVLKNIDIPWLSRNKNEERLDAETVISKERQAKRARARAAIRFSHKNIQESSPELEQGEQEEVTGRALFREEALQELGLKSGASFQEITDACMERKALLTERIKTASSEYARQEYADLMKEIVFLYNFFFKDNTADKLQGLNEIVSDRFEIGNMIGAGAVGAVYEGFDKKYGREIALKVLLPEHLKDQQAVEQFVNEVRLSKKMSHAGIAKVYGVHKEKNYIFISMELLQGRSLRDESAFRQTSDKQFSFEEVLAYAGQLCSALAYVSQYTVHRDLQPENIFLTKSGEIKLTNFGTAWLKHQNHTTKSGEILGAGYYMAPEQLRGKKEADALSEQYSLAVILYELLTGEVPVGMAKPLRKRRSDIPKCFSDAIAKALSVSPDERFSDMAAFSAALFRKGIVFEFPQMKILAQAAVGLAGIFIVIGLTYSFWSPVLKKIIQDPELFERVQEGHRKALARQQAWMAVSAVTDEEMSLSAKTGDAAIQEGKQSLDLKNYRAALLSFEKAEKAYDAAVSEHQNNLLHGTFLDTRIRVQAQVKAFEQQKLTLEKRVKEAFDALGHSKNSIDEKQKVKAGEWFDFMEELKEVCIKALFESEQAAGLMNKINDTDEMVRQKNYSVALMSLQESEKTLQKLLPQVGMIENALKERRSVRAVAKDLLALKAQGVEMPGSLPGAESIRMKAEEYFNQGAWQKSEELFKSILPIYSSAVEEGKKYLGIQIASQEAAKMQSFGFEMVTVKGGCYQMGDLFSRNDPDNDEHPVHEVCVGDFEIGKFEVTQGLWQWVMGSNPSKFKKGDNYPVEQVSWKDVQLFLNVLNQKTGQQFRLPTEAEWEYAARSGGKKEIYSGGDNVETVAWHGTNSAGSTHPVGRKAPNGLGIHDMSGNVYEWCSDWYEHDYYSKSPRNNPKGPDDEVMELLRSSTRVFRGGSWDSSVYYVRNTYRSNRSSDFRYNLLGFRLLKTD